MVVLGSLFGAVGITVAFVAPPIRKYLGYETFQWYGIDEDKVAEMKAQKAEYLKERPGENPKLKQ